MTKAAIPLGRATRMATVLATLAAPTGCVVPVPTGGLVEGSSERSAITDEYFDKLKVGVTNREDVLLLLADPSRRLEDDRVFVYDWTMVPMVIAIGLPGVVTGFAFAQAHLVGMEFGPDSVLTRVARFTGTSSTDKEKSRDDAWNQFETWVKSGARRPRGEPKPSTGPEGPS